MLCEVREHLTPQRLELVLEGEAGRESIAISLRPELPWIGRPVLRWERPRRPPGSFSVACARALTGSVLSSVEKLGSDRVALLRFAGGASLVAELATHGANLVLVDTQGKNVIAARLPRRSQARLAPGEPYRPPGLPPGKLDPFAASPEQIDAFLREALQEGESLFEVLRRRVFGVGPAACRLVIQDAALSGESTGEILARRLLALAKGELDPWLSAPTEDPRAAVEQGDLDPAQLEILPWKPAHSEQGRFLLQGSDPAHTAGLHHDALERSAWIAERGRALCAILRGEVKKLGAAERRAAGDLDAFEDPERHRVWGEALLAGLSRARRSGDVVYVADPYDPLEREIAIPAPARLSLTAAAEDHFRHQRRARRGIAGARKRQEALAARRERLERLLKENEESMKGIESTRVLGEKMRDEGIPVGLEPAGRAGEAAAARGTPRLEGVRLFTSSEGRTILVGRSGKDNDRLTFKLAAAEDFWFHALGVPGAHVVVRNPEREARPPRTTLEEAAAVAAWYSDARGAGLAEVTWTKRKNVRRARGAPPGTVTLKRSETLRVRPRRLSGDQDDAAS